MFKTKSERLRPSYGPQQRIEITYRHFKLKIKSEYDIVMVLLVSNLSTVGNI